MSEEATSDVTTAPDVSTAAEDRPTDRRRRRLIVFAVALLFALAAAGWQGRLVWQLADPAVDRTVRVGETVVVDGSSYRVQTFAIGDSFPNVEPDQPPVRAPRDAAIVLVVLTTEIDESVDPESHTCEATLVDDRGRSWATETTYSYGLRRPEAYGCSGTSDRDIAPGRPLQVGFSFAIPDDAAAEVALQLRLWSKDDFLLRVER